MESWREHGAVKSLISFRAFGKNVISNKNTLWSPIKWKSLLERYLFYKFPKITADFRGALQVIQ